MINTCATNVILILIIVNILVCYVEVKECVEDMSRKPKGLKEPARVEIRSLLVRCPCKEGKNDSKNLKESLEDRKYYDEDLIVHPLVTECKKKVFITMKFQNEGEPPCDDEVIIVDHITDRTTNQRIRLLYPYVFKVKHDHALQLYGLKFMDLVNGEPHEHVINKNCKKFRGCDDSSKNPTCGFAFNEETVVPYSQGFCCSCDSMVNIHREGPVTFGNPKEETMKGRRSAESVSSINNSKPHHHNFSMHNKYKISRHHRDAKRVKPKEMISNYDNRDESKISTVKQSHSHQRRCSKNKLPKREYSSYRKDRVNFSPDYDGMYDEDYSRELEDKEKLLPQHRIHKRELISSSEINEIKPAKSKSLNTMTVSYSDNVTKCQRDTSVHNRHKREPEKLKEPLRVDIPIPLFIPPIKTEINQWERKPDDYFYDNIGSDMYYDEKHDGSSKENESFHKLRRDVKSGYEHNSKEVGKLEDDDDDDDEEMKENYRYTPLRKSNIHTKVKENRNDDIDDYVSYDDDGKESDFLSDQKSAYPGKLFRVQGKSENVLNDYKRLQVSKRTKKEGSAEGNADVSDASEISSAEFQKNPMIDVKIVQRRGGQNCANKSTPPYADPNKYHESAHCLRFSNLWYSVYSLEKPIIDPNMYFHIFENHGCEEENHWVDLTQGKSVRVGTFCPKVSDDAYTFAITYSSCDEGSEQDFALDYKVNRLLIPEPVADENAELYPQLQGGPKEYLVVKADQISTSGEDCDKAGVSYEAFVKQPNRCEKPKGTCLKNQPIAMWRQDIEARLEGRKGQYFLENFGTLPEQPVKMAGPEREEYISLRFDGKYGSTINIEINADRNALVEVGVLGRITEVYVDATCPARTHIYVIITNTGLASSGYMVKLTECAPDVPSEWDSQKPVAQKIPPQHVKEFHLPLDGELTREALLCTVQLVNEHQELLAKRRIRIQKGERCHCLWYCLCACFGGAEGLQCHPLSTEEYRDAGFRGSLPVTTGTGTTLWMHIIFLLATFFLVLLLLGAIKGILGLCCCPLVGAWGLDVLVEHPRQIPHYYEEELHGRTVIYDCGGYPVHPDTKLRTVRTISRTTEFCLNLVFFLAFPCAICCSLMRRSLTRRDEEMGEPIDWSNTIIIKEQKGPGGKYECYGIGGRQYCAMENADTKYVMDELKRSRKRLMSCGCSDDQIPLLNKDECICAPQRKEGYQRPCPFNQQPQDEGYQRRTSASSGQPPGPSDGYQRRNSVNSQQPLGASDGYQRQSTQQPQYDMEGSQRRVSGGNDGSRRNSLRSNSNQFVQAGLPLPPPADNATGQQLNDEQRILKEPDLAMELVEQLLDAPVVYRTLREPVGNVVVDADIPYSIRGTFTARDQGYLFFPEQYSKQYWGIIDGNHVGAMENPHYLDPLPLAKLYNTPQEVYNADSLTDFPRSICINVENEGEAVQNVTRQ